MKIFMLSINSNLLTVYQHQFGYFDSGFVQQFLLYSKKDTITFYKTIYWLQDYGK